MKELGALTLDKEALYTVNRLREAEGVPGLDSGDAAIASDSQTSLEETGGSGIMGAEGESGELKPIKNMWGKMKGFYTLTTKQMRYKCPIICRLMFG